MTYKNRIPLIFYINFFKSLLYVYLEEYFKTRINCWILKVDHWYSSATLKSSLRRMERMLITRVERILVTSEPITNKFFYYSLCCLFVCFGLILCFHTFKWQMTSGGGPDAKIFAEWLMVVTQMPRYLSCTIVEWSPTLSGRWVEISFSIGLKFLSSFNYLLFFPLYFSFFSFIIFLFHLHISSYIYLF